MYYIYQNLQSKKQCDFVSISIEGTLVLEQISDDFNVTKTFPKFLDKIVTEMFPIQNYDIYKVFTLNIQNYSRITDYKKIWKLGAFDKQGFYDNFYDKRNERVYFGICKNIFPNVYGLPVGEITIYVPKESELFPEAIFDFFAKRKFDIKHDIMNHFQVLSTLQKEIKNSIIIDKIQEEKYILNIYGTGIDRIFDMKKLDCSDIMESE